MPISLSSTLEPLALGFSTGTWCAVYCGPALLPFLLGRESPRYGRNGALISLFLAGRLVAYGALGLALSLLGLLVRDYMDPVAARRLSAWAYLLCGAVLLTASLRERRKAGSGREGCPGCAGKGSSDSPGEAFRNDAWTALLSGAAVGLHICPAFWTAAFRSFNAPSAASGAAYFALFYAGTLPFFVPLLGLPFLSRKNAPPRSVARLTQAFVGAYFVLFAGLIPILLRR